MTLEEALAILSKYRHNDTDEWDQFANFALPGGAKFYHALTAFEAIAVAEKYQRDEREKVRPDFPIPELNPRGFK